MTAKAHPQITQAINIMLSATPVSYTHLLLHTGALLATLPYIRPFIFEIHRTPIFIRCFHQRMGDTDADLMLFIIGNHYIVAGIRKRLLVAIHDGDCLLYTSRCV